MPIPHVMRAKWVIGIVDFIKEQKDVIVRNWQRVLQVHNVVMTAMVNGSSIGERELVHSMSTILKLGEISLPINIFSPMFSPICHVVMVQPRCSILVNST
jgi:hypothetical protein